MHKTFMCFLNFCIYVSCLSSYSLFGNAVVAPIYTRFRVLQGYDGGCNFVAGKNLRIVCQVSDRSSGPVAVCFMVEPSGRYDCGHSRVVFRADTYVETGVDELPRQFGFAAEAVDYPWLRRAEGFA